MHACRLHVGESGRAPAVVQPRGRSRDSLESRLPITSLRRLLEVFSRSCSLICLWNGSESDFGADLELILERTRVSVCGNLWRDAVIDPNFCFGVDWQPQFSVELTPFSC